ncbi:hypothetical protein JRQ81_007679 [Phrynocephalus forsythii]|uniref:SH3 domain-containing protein n=1 Tax=Phrynocephalus forsythii TaxID=171643 RepID=A0A9Q0XC17_9SAUR|nr:hypothetical protein JRQ81_007679 [Phrynocephalus forsythii]
MTSKGGRPPSRGSTRLPPRKSTSQPVGPDLAAGHGNASTSASSRGGAPFSSLLQDHHRELEALRSELEAERLWSQEAQRRFASEVRELRQAAERERQLLADQLRSKWEQQRARELHQLREANLKEREAEIRQLLRWKEAELREAQELLQRERDAAMRQARDLQRQLAEELANWSTKSPGGVPAGSSGSALLSTEAQAKLQEVRGKLRREVESEQAARIRHLKAELELERSLFLKYILERFEGECNLQRYRPASPKKPQPELPAKREKRRPRSLESLAAAGGSPQVKPASKSRSLNSNLSPYRSSHHHHYDFPDGRIPKDGSDGPLQPQVLSERPLEEVSKTPMDPPPERKGSRWDAMVEGPSIADGQQPQPQGRLSASSYQQLTEQNERFLKVLSDLERQCTLLREENTQLRKRNFPVMEKLKQLKMKNTELTEIARRLEENAKKLQESGRKMSDAPVPRSLSGPDVELEKTSLAGPQAKKTNGEAGVPLAKDQDLCLQRGRGELQIEPSAGIKSLSCVKTMELASMPGESQREGLPLQRQLVLTYQKESPQHTEMNSKDPMSSVIAQETSLDRRLEDSVSPEEMANALATSTLRVFLARYSYNPFEGPNENPQAELPLTAGEYVYVYGEMDEDGFYLGELMDGRRGMVPSNLIEKVSHNELISFVSSSSSSDDTSNPTANTI